MKVTSCEILMGAPLVETARVNQQRSSFDMLSTCSFSCDVDLRKKPCR